MTKLPEPTAIAICYDGTPYSLWHYGDGPLLDAEIQRQGGTASKLLLYDKQAISDALEAQAREIERLRKDAERYQFLRYCDLDEMAQEYWPGGDVPTGEALDSAIDAAMKKKAQP